MEAVTSRNIPLPMQREIRRRCGFGCVICGLPLYEYEHMMEWATVQRHEADEITLLCTMHHTEKTKGLLPKDVVAKANKNPFNLQKGVSKPYDLHFSGRQAEIEIGGNSFKFERSDADARMAAIVIDDLALMEFKLQDEHLLLSLIAFNSQNAVILEITDNALTYQANNWDIQFTGTTITIREGLGDILYEIKFSPPQKIAITRGLIHCNGATLEVTQESLKIGNQYEVSGNYSEQAQFGIVVGKYVPSGGCLLTIGEIRRDVHPPIAEDIRGRHSPEPYPI